MRRSTRWERPWCWAKLRAGGEGDDRGWDGWMASPTRWTWVWINSRSWWWTGKSAVHGVAKSQTRLSDWTTTNLRFFRLECALWCFARILFVYIIIFPHHSTTNGPGILLAVWSYSPSVQFSRSVMSDSSQTHGLQHARPPCPSAVPGAYSNSCPLSRWCHPTISSSVAPFSSCPQSFPASGSFPMS